MMIRKNLATTIIFLAGIHIPITANQTATRNNLEPTNQYNRGIQIHPCTKRTQKLKTSLYGFHEELYERIISQTPCTYYLPLKEQEQQLEIYKA